jgi:hypothetical protein
MNPWIIGSVAALIFAGGKASEDVGQGVDSASNAVLKIGLGLGVGFFVLKRAKVI